MFVDTPLECRRRENSTRTTSRCYLRCLPALSRAAVQTGSLASPSNPGCRRRNSLGEPFACNTGSDNVEVNDEVVYRLLLSNVAALRACASFSKITLLRLLVRNKQ